MQAAGQLAEPGRKDRKKTGAQRKRVETVVETLATLRSQGETLSAVAHDARNMVTALGLYCDLLDEPGVLAAPFAHYGSELRLVAAASRRLVEKLVMLDAQAIVADPLAMPAATPAGRKPPAVATEPHSPSRTFVPARESDVVPIRRPAPARFDLMPAVPVDNLAAELLANRNLLSALAGPSIALTVDARAGARPARITSEDLTRVLVNLVKNAVEAMPAGGRIHLTLSERPATARTAGATSDCMVLTVEDNGPGIPVQALEEIFVSGYSTRTQSVPDHGGWPSLHRGLGLTITRSIVEAAGGRIAARNREAGGASIEIELPVRGTGNRDRG